MAPHSFTLLCLWLLWHFCQVDGTHCHSYGSMCKQKNLWCHTPGTRND